MFDEQVAIRLCMDAHVFGKNTQQLYRSLFTFTNALLICAGDRVKVTANTFKDLYSFMDTAVSPSRVESPNQALAMDFLALPQLLLQNLAGYPKLFKSIQAEAYLGADADLQMQLVAAVSVILNRSIGNPHMRIDLVTFLLHLAPQKNVGKHHEK